MTIKLNDTKLFGNFAAEDETIEVLDSYFVDKPEYKEFRSDDKLWIVRAKKGMGKSALLKKVAHEKSVSDPNDIVIQVKGSDIIRNNFPEGLDVQQLIYNWQTAICSRVAVEINKRSGLSMTDDSITVVDNADLEEFKEKNLADALIDRMKRKIGNVRSEDPLLTSSLAILERYEEKQDRKVWLFIDDIDATFNNSEDESKRLSSFFTACRYLIQSVNRLHIRASVRTDVWAVIADTDESLDKVDQPQYMMELNWTEFEVKNIIANRIRSYVLTNLPEHPNFKEIQNMGQTNKEIDNIMGQIFKTVIPWGTGVRKPSVVIYTLSNRRPRWAIHLCYLAGRSATNKSKNRIGIEELTENLDEYGRRRLTDIVREHEHQSKNIRDFINAFAKKQVRYSTEQLFEIINEEIFSKIDPVIDGIPGKPNEMDVAHFLFRMGFITAREDVPGAEYIHYNFEDDHTLLKSTVNPDKGYSWEIHPSFRTALRTAEEGNVKLIEEFIPQKGKVKWFNARRGYGFIETDEFNDVFVHFSSIIQEGFKTLGENDLVEFLLKKGERGHEAINVIKILQ